MSLRDLTLDLMSVPGLAGHEVRIRARLREHLGGLATQTDRLGNLWTTRAGDTPSVLLFTHMDQLGFVVRRIETDGYLRLERLGGVPEKALPSQEVVVPLVDGRDIAGVIANKSHHATAPEEKYTVTPYRDLYVDCGFESRAEAEDAGIRIGAPVVYAPRGRALGKHRLTGTSVDDRAGCAVLIEVARTLAETRGATVHTAFTVQEEFNLRGAQPLAQHLLPDIAIQVDLMLATDTPDMAGRGEMHLGGGPGISLLSFHGRGTLNGVIPHPAMVRLFEETARAEGIPLQRSAQTGVLTDLSYVQVVGEGVACIDVGFPMRYSHSSREVVDLRDLERLRDLLVAAIARIGPDFPLKRVP
jgi:putative aminopeptidase FrvX